MSALTAVASERVSADSQFLGAIRLAALIVALIAAQEGICLLAVHIGADIVVTARRHWWQTRNITWLRQVGQPIAAAVADYYCSRTTPSTTLPAFLHGAAGVNSMIEADQLSIAGVLGPDEHDDNVTDSTCMSPYCTQLATGAMLPIMRGLHASVTSPSR